MPKPSTAATSCFSAESQRTQRESATQTVQKRWTMLLPCRRESAAVPLASVKRRRTFGEIGIAGEQNARFRKICSRPYRAMPTPAAASLICSRPMSGK